MSNAVASKSAPENSAAAVTSARTDQAMAWFAGRVRWSWPEIALWVAALAIAFLFPSRALFAGG